MSTPSLSGARDDLDPRTDARLSHTMPEHVRWLWPGRIPLGKLTVMEGDPAVGKSTLTLDLAARVTTGVQWPDGQPGTASASVLLLSAEDGLADTIRPRLEAAGADLDRVVAWGKEWDQQDVDWHLRPVVFPTDLSGLERRIRRDEARLVVVDVLVAYLSDRIDAHKDQAVRVLLSRLAEVAERSGAAIIMLRHLNKSGTGPAIYRGGGSIGIIGAARAGYQVIRDGDDPNRRLFACIKLNLAPEPPTLAYQLIGVPELGVAKVDWEANPDPRSADDLHADAVTGPTKLRVAADWLADYGTTYGGHAHSVDVIAAASQEGISEPTLRRARAKAGIVVADDRSGLWTWPSA
jgi:hypothetical protein